MPRIRIDLPEKLITTIKIPVRITDINYGNHVGNNSFVEIIHEARMQFLSQYGFTELDIAGSSLIMDGLAIEFKNESFYKDLLVVKIFVGEISRVSFELYYSVSTVRNNKEIFVAKAKTSMVCFNYNEKNVEAIPEELKKILTP
jgi:acyl-CoA thioester hydrolase